MTSNSWQIALVYTETKTYRLVSRMWLKQGARSRINPWEMEILGFVETDKVDNKDASLEEQKTIIQGNKIVP